MPRQYTVKDGLASNTIYTVLQDSEGFLWFATDQGISRFDGNFFQNYTTRDGLPDNEVFALKEDGHGRIWISSYNARTSFIHKGQIFNASNNFVCRVIEQDSLLQKLRFNAGIPPHILLKGIADPAGKLKAYSYFNVVESEHLLHSDYEDLFFMHNYVCLIKNGKVHTIISQCKRAFYKDGFLYLFHVQKGRFFLSKALYNTDTVYIVNSQDFPFAVVYQFAVQNDSTLLLATDKGVLPYITTTGHVDTQNILLKDLPVNMIKKDTEGNFWFTTLSHGIYFLSASQPPVYKTKNGTPGTITILSTGTLVAGYDGKGVQVFDKDRTRFFALPGLRIKDRIKKAIPISGAKIIIGTDYGTYCLDIAGNSVRNFKPYPLIDAVKDIYRHDKKLFLAGVHGASIIDGNGRPLQQIWKERTTAIAGRDSVIWLGTLQGVYRKKQNEAIEKLATNALLSTSRITDIEIAQNGDVIFLTHQAGVFAWNGKTMQHIDEQTGLSSNICRRIFLDDEHNIWLLTNGGIDRLLQKDNRYNVEHCHLSNGLAESNVTDFAIHNHKLYVSYEDGIVELDLKQKKPQRSLKVYITSVTLKDTAIVSPADIRLSYKQRDLTINYTALAFQDGRNVTYRYILEGGDSDTIITKLTSVNLSAVSPGNYVFKVWAKGANEIWNSEPARLSVTISQPFWLEEWFLLLVLSVVALLIYTYVRRRVNTIRKTERTKTELNKKMAKLEMQALRAQINPHFIFNALNAIQNYYNMNDERNANRYMTMFANLIRRTLAYSKDNWINLPEEVSMLRTYIELEKMRFKDTFDFEILVSENINVEHTKIPAMLIQPFVENAINHGLRHLRERRGNLIVRFSSLGKCLLCVVEDNGVGFRQAAVIEQRTRPVHKPMGMDITSGRIETMNLLYNTSINVNVIHKDTSYDSGAIVEITIPTIKNHE
ncbi:MAG TPA: histidine kinase [Flavipsychrobacter sp.]|nr:histidine kinase [Flavipsychrobacter sp.]